MAVKCAVVSRWACRKRRRRNSPCIREDVLVMAGMKIIMMFKLRSLALSDRVTGILPDHDDHRGGPGPVCVDFCGGGF